MGILGELPPDDMLKRLDREVRAWEHADSTTPVIPALHLITVVAQGSPGRDGMYRARMSDSLIERVYGWAQRHKAIMFLDLQVAKSTLQAELPRLTSYLSRPDVHLAIDPEFSMKRGGAPGKRIGTYDASDVNYAIGVLADLVEKHNLPPKVLVVHRFTRPMLTNASRIKLDPRVQVVIHMDGWGPPWMKKDSYQAYVYAEPVQYTGFKLFYKNDTKKGHPLMKPSDVLALFPAVAIPVRAEGWAERGSGCSPLRFALCPLPLNRSANVLRWSTAKNWPNASLSVPASSQLSRIGQDSPPG
jgi:hypothetical protein